MSSSVPVGSLTCEDSLMPTKMHISDRTGELVCVREREREREIDKGIASILILFKQRFLDFVLKLYFMAMYLPFALIPIFKKIFFNLCIYFWLHWVFVAVLRLSVVAASGGYSSLRRAGLSLRWLLLSRSTGSWRAGFSSCGTRAQLLRGV